MGKTVQHTIAGSDSAVLIGHVIVINLNVVTTVHTDLVVDGAAHSTQAAVGDWLIDGIDAFIQVIDRCAPEVDDSRHGCVQEDRAAARHTHGFVERIDGIFLSGVNGVDFGLTREVEVRIVDDQGIGALDGEERTSGITERLWEVVLTATVDVTIVAYIDTSALFTGIAGGTATQEATLDVHVGRCAFVGSLGVVAFAIHVDVRIT